MYRCLMLLILHLNFHILEHCNYLFDIMEGSKNSKKN